jgi:hypothetical protein
MRLDQAIFESLLSASDAGSWSPKDGKLGKENGYEVEGVK